MTSKRAVGIREFRLRFPLREIPRWSARYAYAGSEDVFLKEVRPLVVSRGYLTRHEFLEVCHWKSPRTQPWCRENTAEQVRILTAAAFTAEEALAVDLLRLLNGVDYPTASTLLHFFASKPYPILDYRAIWSLGHQQPKRYTMPYWLEYVRFTRDLAKRTGHSMRTVDRALWQYSKEHQI